MTDQTKADLVRQATFLRLEVQGLKRELRARQSFPWAFWLGDSIGAFAKGFKTRLRGF